MLIVFTPAWCFPDNIIAACDCRSSVPTEYISGSGYLCALRCVKHMFLLSFYQATCGGNTKRIRIPKKGRRYNMLNTDGILRNEAMIFAAFLGVLRSANPYIVTMDHCFVMIRRMCLPLCNNTLNSHRSHGYEITSQLCILDYNIRLTFQCVS